MILTISQKGIEDAQVGFRRLEGALKDLRPIWPAVRRYFHDTEALAFASEGGDQRTGRWKPLSPAYAKWKARHYPGKGILERTGALWKSLTGGPGGRAILEAQRFTEESMVPYARFHAGDGRVNRFPVSLRASQLREIGAIVGRELQKDIRKGFSKTVPA